MAGCASLWHSPTPEMGRWRLFRFFLRCDVQVVFLDDCEAELATFRKLFGGFGFQITTVLADRPSAALANVSKRLKGRIPDLLVLDLYYPQTEDAPQKLRSGATLEACRQIAAIADVAAGLPADFPRPLDLLKEAHNLVSESRQLLSLLCEELRQSPEAGVRILRELRLRYPNVPMVFYSRKATIADLKSALRAGATDLLLKPHPREEAREARRLAALFIAYAERRPATWLQRRAPGEFDHGRKRRSSL